MENYVLDELVGGLASCERVSADTWYALLTSVDDVQRQELANRAQTTAQSVFGKGVYVRALLEISSYCRNNCFYCGLRCGNSAVQRYRLDKQQIMECCREGAALGFNTFVLQGGEDTQLSDEWLADVVEAIKTEYPDKAVTLSVGERSYEGYALMRSAGTDRYLLRHETADDRHYGLLHPPTMSAENRRRCLVNLKELGYQVGAGMMIGSPGQTVEHLVKDLMFLDELQPQMIGIGPFIPAAGTPFAGEPSGSVETTLLLVSLLRLRFPSALIPATTAVATLCGDGTQRAVLAGANVVMPNLTPPAYRDKYSIYNNKKSTGSESARQLEMLADSLEQIGYCIDYSRGDYRSVVDNNQDNYV